MPYRLRRSLHRAIIKLMLLSLLSSTLAGLIPPLLVTQLATAVLPTAIAEPVADALLNLFPRTFSAAAAGKNATSTALLFAPQQQAVTCWDLITTGEDRNELERFNQNGVFQGVFYDAPGAYIPEGIAQGPDGLLYVVDANYPNNRVVKHDPNSGQLLSTFISIGTSLLAPNKLLFGPDGNLYVLDRMGDKVARYNGQTGALIGDFVTANSGGLDNPRDMVFSPDGQFLYIASENTRQVLKYNGSTGAFVSVAFQTSGGVDLFQPGSLTFGPDGSLYMSDDHIALYRVLKGNVSNGSLTVLARSPGSFGLRNIVRFGPDGMLYFVSNNSHQIFKWNGSSWTLWHDSSANSGLYFHHLGDMLFRQCPPTTDWGDLPDDDSTAGSPNSPGYNTNSTGTTGPSHVVVSGLRLGNAIDAESNAQPNATATGDDIASSPGDEDGVTLPSFSAGQSTPVTAAVLNSTGNAATLYGFIDWNGDNDFSDLGESVSQSVASQASSQNITLNFSVPTTATVTSQVGARFRLSTTANLGADGAATDGEVEDYLIKIAQFDLALKKTTATTTANPGDDVTFTIEVTNQGTADAYNIQVTDYITSGFTFDAANATNVTNGWALVAGRPTLTIAGPLAAGNSTSKQIVLRVASAYQGTQLTNYAEISAADNDANSANTPPTDVDSTPDATDTNDGGAKDNVINENGKANPGVNDEDDHDPASISVGQTFDLALKKTTAATTVQPGDDVQFTIQVVNQGTLDAYNIQLTDYVPAGFTFDAANATNVAAGWALVAGRPTKTIAGPLAKGASIDVQIMLRVDAAFQGTSLTNYAEISSADNDADPANTPPTDVDSTPDATDTNDGAAKDNVISENGKANPGVNDEDDHDPASVNVNQTFDLALKKTTAATTVQPGDDVQFTIQVVNQGTLDAYNIQLTDYIPAGFTFDAINATNVANGWNLVAGKPIKSIAGPLTRGATIDVQIVLRVDATFLGTSLTNYAEINSADNDTNTLNAAPTDVDSTPDTDNTNDDLVKDNVISENWKSDTANNDQDDHDPASVNVNQTFDLALQKITAAGTVQQGDDVPFTIRVINQGVLTAYNIQLTDYVPAGFTFDATNAVNSAAGWVLVAGKPTLTIAGPLAKGASTDVQIVLKVDATFQETSLTNVAEISAADNDTDPTNTPPVDVDSTPDSNNTNDGTPKDNEVNENAKNDPTTQDEDDHDVSILNVGQIFDLALQKTTAATTVQLGDDVQFTIRVINQGTLNAYNIVVSDYVPTGFTFDATNAVNSAAGWALVAGKPTLTLAGPLAQGASTDVQIVLKVDTGFQGTSLSNYAEISSADNDADPVNSLPVDVDSTPDADNANDGSPKNDVIDEDGKSDPLNQDEDDHDPAEVNVGQIFDLALQKTTTATSVQPGDDVQFTLRVVNQGTLDAYNIVLTDYVPAGFIFDATNATNVANGWSEVNSQPTLSIAGPLAKGASIEVQIVLQVDATFLGTNLTNSAEISAADNDADENTTPPVDADSTPDADDGNDGVPNDNVIDENAKADPSNNDEDDHDIAGINIGETFDLALIKTGPTNPVHQNDRVPFTITIQNQGTHNVYNIVLTDYVPTGFTFDASDATNVAAGWVLVNGRPTKTLAGPLAGGTSITTPIVLKVEATFQGTSLTNVAEISVADNDTDPANAPPVDVDSTPDTDGANDGVIKDNVSDEDGKANPEENDEDDHDPAMVNVGQTFDLALLKTTALASAQQGMEVLFTLTVQNQGTLDAYNVELTDYLPTGLVFEPINAINIANGWSLVNGLPTQMLTGPVAAGTITTVQIVLRVDATFQGRSLINVAEISAADNDPNSANPPPVDVDSTPDPDNANDGTPKDDVINEDGKADPINNDEDDHDLSKLPIILYDWGDLPDGNAATSPNYNTDTNGAVAGPSHELVPGLQIGAVEDGETNGQPNAAADGDDNAGSPNDEDGVSKPAQIIAGQPADITVSVINTTSKAATLSGFIDWNADGDFGDTSETVSQLVNPSATSQNVVLNFTVPATATTTSQLGARFRLSTASNLGPDGPAADGEVEDCLIAVNAIYDWGDLPDDDSAAGSPLSPSYNTNSTGASGPSHQIVSNLRIGATVDDEADGQPNADAAGDDVTDDEEGVTKPNQIVAGSSTVITVSVLNNTLQDATLYGFIDWNGDGDFSDLNETVRQSVSTQAASRNVLLSFSVPATATTTSQLGARFRLSTDNSLGADGPAPNGEVEDYLVQVTAYDFGDLPDVHGAAGSPTSPDYNTDLTGIPGASHSIVPGLQIGSRIDAEANGQPDGTATGDDTLPNGKPDDEDGVTKPPLFVPGTNTVVTVTVVNTTGQPATLHGFIDWNGDGDFVDGNEATTAPASSSGPVLLNFTIPATATLHGDVGARFRLSTQAQLGADGPAPDGEVEDCLVKLTPQLSLGNLVWDDKNNDGRYDADGADNTPGTADDEPGLPNVRVKLFASDGSAQIMVGPDGVLGTADDALDGMLTTATGHYLFAGLAPGEYIVEVTTPAGYTSSTGVNAQASGPYEPAPDEEVTVADSDDNGTATSPTVVRSLLVVLRISGEPQNEADLGDLANPATDASSNLQVDFGFYQPHSLGNAVWIDANNDGLRLNENAAPDGMLVNLYFDADNSGLINGGETTPISTTTTAGGLYLFRHLRAGNYQVELAPSNFQANGLLAGYLSSTGQNGAATGPVEPAPDADSDPDDGDDNGSQAVNGGIVSALVTLGAEQEPGNEQPDNDGVTPDANENLTVDFGLFRPLSLGNLVWNDRNNDGLYDADGLDNQPNTSDDENGLANVPVQLLDSQGNVVSSTTTSAAGLYRFTHLLPGDYTVCITPPAGYVSSTGQNALLIGPYEAAPDPDLGRDGVAGGGDDDQDGDDNGTTGSGPTAGKVLALAVTLTPAGEPVGENPNNDPTTADADSNLTVDFGLFLPAALGNRVWYDVNKDGVQDNPIERGVPGVVVKLTLGAGLVVSTTTDATGHYTFTHLIPGDYGVEFILPPGYARSPLDTGGNTLASDPIDSDADPATGRTVAINLVAGETDLTWDAGIYYNASLGDRVWLDRNANGVQNTGEPGIPNVTVTLLDGNGQPVGNPTQTDPNGFYSFPNLPPGNYQVQFTLPPGYVISPQDTGGNTPTSEVNDSDASPVDGKTAVITLDPNENDSTWDAGLYLPVSLGNLVWEDKNNDGLYDADGADNTPGTADDEPGISNVTVKLLASGGVGEIPVGPDGILGTADDGPGGVKTDANGLYRFSNLTPNIYRVQVEAPVGYASSTGATGLANGPYEPAPDPDSDVNNDDNGSITSGTPATGQIIKSGTVTLRSGLEPAAPTKDDGDSDNNSNLTVDFGLFRPLSLGNRVWNDANNSGKLENGEQGLPNVTVKLYNNTGTTLLASTTTNATGYYLFSNLLAGDYVVAVDKSTLPPGYITSSGQNGSLSGPYEPAPDEDSTSLDNDDNGTASGALIVGQAVTLSAGGEPTGELDTGNLANPVPDANSNLQVDFGFYQPLSLGNLVWDDKDNNGVVNNGEPGVANVTVKLLAADGLTLIAQTVTDGQGGYRFDNLAPGDYCVVIETPAGYVSSSGQNGSASGPYEPAPDPDDDRNNDDNGSVSAGAAPASLTIKAALVTLSVNGEPATPTKDDGDSNVNTNLSVDFGIYRPLSLGNLVWDDLNNSGQVDNGEVGLPNVTVNLYASDGVTLVGTITTNATGHYLFAYLTPGDYVVEVVESSLPSGYVTSTGQNGSASGPYEPAPDEDVNPADNDDNGEALANGVVTSKAVSLYGDTEPLNEPDAGDLANPIVDGNSNLQVDFGFYLPARLGNWVWWDVNKDGVQDGNETGVPGVIVNLYDADDQLVGTTSTASTGLYTFTNLSPGDYVVEFELPSGYARSPLDTTSDDADSDADSATGRTVPINLSAGEVDVTWDAGIYFNAALGDRVWNDLNANGVQDDSDPGVSGVLVTLFNNVNQMVGLPTLTDATGNYAFGDLPLGDYYVQFTPSAGYLISPQDVGANDPASDGMDSDVNPLDGKTVLTHIDPSEHDPTWDAGLYQPASLGDKVWEDYNGNGVQEENEPGVPNVKVELLDKDNNLLASTTTDGVGLYLFSNLLPGDYHVRFTPPAGYTLTLVRLEESEEEIDSDADPVTGETPLTTLTSGEHDPTWDAGLYRLLSLGNLVFDDRLNNGHREQPLDKGVDGVLVNLYRDADSSGDLTLGDGAPIASTTTAGGGFYRFDNLYPGDYLVELDQSNFLLNAVLERYASSLASLLPGGSDKVIDPDTDRDNDDNGIQQRNPRSIVSRAVTLALNSEPHNDGDGDRYSNLSVDFGVYDPDLGDLVWYDADADGVFEPAAGEYGIADVLLKLYEDNGATLGVYDAGDTFVLTTMTDADGIYLFGFLPPRDYIVMVDAGNFQPGQPLAGLANSRGDSDPDDNINTDENGVPLTLGGAVVAKPVTLTSGGEPVDDGDSDEFTNLTIDFGFHPALRLGNQVWHDRNDNGLLDSGEEGLAGVTVQLFWATDDPTKTQPLITATTDANGFYLFQSVGSGKYIVRLPTPPSQYPLSSAPTDTADNGEDNDDNGSQNSAGGPVISPVIDLTLGSEPTGDGDNANGDLTIDFGLLPLKPNLVLDKSVANPTVSPGGVVRYTLTYTNTGVGVARQTVLTETVAAGTTFEPSQSSPGWQCSNGGAAGALCHISLGDVTPGQRGTVDFALKLGSNVAVLDMVPNVAIVGTLDLELQYTDNNDRADVYVQTPQAISLVFFTAETHEGAIVLRWQSSIELNTRGYLIYRSSNGQRPDARQLTAELIPNLGLQGGDYTFTDREVELNQTYTYWLVEVDTDGQMREYGLIQIGLYANNVYLPLIGYRQ